jgi:hypothetical protein
MVRVDYLALPFAQGTRVFAFFCKKKRFLFFFEKKNQKTFMNDPS